MTGDPDPAVRIERLCGQRRRRTTVGGIVLGALVTVVSASVWLLRWSIGGEGPRYWHLAGPVDTVVTLGIVGVAASTGLGLLYAVWNGGPLLAFAIPFVPKAIGTLAARGWTLDQDLGIVLSAGAAAAALAVYGAGRLQAGTWWPSSYPGIVDGLTVATPSVILAGGALLELRGAVGPHATDPLWLAWSLWGLGAVLVLVEWAICVRDATAADGSVGTTH